MADRWVESQEQVVGVIEPASWRDVMAIYRLSQICFGRDAWPWLDILAALSAPGAVRFKAVVDQELIGYVIGDRRARRLGWIASVAVHPDHRRRGWGSRLLVEAERHLNRSIIRLTLRRSNGAAMALYRRHGYRQVEVWPSYYHDREDGLVMEKTMGVDEQL